MSDLQIGIDLEEISRFQKIPYAKNKEFYGKLFTLKEIQYCLSKKNPYPHFAARFCAKEALIKALGKQIDLKHVEVVRAKNRPSIRIIGSSSKRFLKGSQFQVSLSHTKNYAVAVVVFEKKL